VSVKCKKCGRDYALSLENDLKFGHGFRISAECHGQTKKTYVGIDTLQFRGAAALEEALKELNWAPRPRLTYICHKQRSRKLKGMRLAS
jgi:hypothetical protein